MGILEQLAEMKAQEGLEKGLQQGRAEEREKNVKSLLASAKFSTAEIASLLGVSVPFVEKQKKSLQLI